MVRSTVALGAAGVAASFPALAPALNDAEAEAPEAEAWTASASAPDLSESLIAHVKDLSTGEISLYSGTREFVVRDPGLAARLANAAR